MTTLMQVKTTVHQMQEMKDNNMNNECTHTYRDGTSAITFPRQKKWIGIHPCKVKGLCKICKQTVEISEHEYRNLKRGD